MVGSSIHDLYRLEALATDGLLSAMASESVGSYDESFKHFGSEADIKEC